MTYIRSARNSFIGPRLSLKSRLGGSRGKLNSLNDSGEEFTPLNNMEDIELHRPGSRNSNASHTIDMQAERRL
jgi:hypothetical protein